MKFKLVISSADIAKVTALIKSQANSAFVRTRCKRNLAKVKPRVTREILWKRLICTRLTTRQNSSPEGFVAKFSRERPFPLTYKAVHGARNAEILIAKALRAAGGIRFADKIASEMSQNFRLLETGEWAPALEQCNRLTRLVSREVEIEVAEHVQKQFIGFGPKQSRNVLQSLGLTRYEIPIDSRLTDWLNEFGFPVRLSAGALQDANYYRFISDGIHMLCERSGVLPCVFDAAVFALRDSADWTDENVIF